VTDVPNLLKPLRFIFVKCEKTSTTAISQTVPVGVIKERRKWEYEICAAMWRSIVRLQHYI